MTILAFIGFGEVGRTFARGLIANKGVSIAAYDLLFDDAAVRAERIAEARALGRAGWQRCGGCQPRCANRHLGGDGGRRSGGGARRLAAICVRADLPRRQLGLALDQEAGGGASSRRPAPTTWKAR